MIWTVAALILLGIALLVVELVVLPGINLAGIAGSIMLAGGIYVSYRVFGTSIGHLVLAGTLILLVLTLTVALRSGTWKKISLSTEIDSRVNEPECLLHEGDCGVTTTRLAPMGMVDFGGHESEVRSDGQLIDAGTAVVVIRMQDGRATVKPAASDAE